MPPINISAAARASALFHNPLSNALRIQTQNSQFPRLTTKSNTAMDQPPTKIPLISDNNNTPTTTTTTLITPTVTPLTPHQTLQPLAKFKARSHETSLTEHLPLLASHFPNQNGLGPTVVLLGDSMFERLKTTGLAPLNQPTAPWPWPALLDDATLASLEMQRLEGVFNAGVGGDMVQNIAYRLVGDESRGLPGLFPALVGRGTVRLWVVQAGTNNLKVKKGLGEADVERLRVVVGCWLRADPGCRVL
jgi:platelet-activating factor acetylhydrolase IB subunit beta/gamma